MDVWPAKLRFKKSRKHLTIEWEGGEESIVHYRALRAASPSAQNKLESAEDVPETISVDKAEPVGRYAVRIHFSDGHNTGLYRWGLLHALGLKDA